MEGLEFGEDFDQYAAEYDNALQQGLSATGETKSYFAEGRIAWLAQCLKQLNEHPSQCLDFGCGTGSAIPYLLGGLEVESAVGLDISPASLAAARSLYGSENVQFILFQNYEPDGRVDLVFCNGVFHHISPERRGEVIDYIYRTLRPGGLFALWENNPWNPGTRYVMSRIPFDKNAHPLSAVRSRRLLKAGGLDVIRTDFMFIFPKQLRWLRGAEPLLSRLPLGGQYQVLCRKPNKR